MRLINFRCPTCGKEKETDPLTTDEYVDMMEKIKQGVGPVYVCEDCKKEMIVFNFARSFRWRYMDD